MAIDKGRLFDYLKVWFNVGVDIVVCALFGIPLFKAIANSKNQSGMD